jgi:hypothetical protein
MRYTPTRQVLARGQQRLLFLPVLRTIKNHLTESFIAIFRNQRSIINRCVNMNARSSGIVLPLVGNTIISGLAHFSAVTALMRIVCLTPPRLS